MDWPKLQRIAKSHARKKGFEHLADDFAQEYCIKMFEGRKASVEQVFIDFLRKEYGDARSPGGRERMRINHSLVRETKAASGEEPKPIDQCLPCPRGDSQPERRIGRVGGSLFGSDSLIYELYFEDEWTKIEIAALFGVTESRICQRLGRVKRLVTRQTIFNEVGDVYHDDKEYSKLEIEWITV